MSLRNFLNFDEQLNPMKELRTGSLPDVDDRRFKGAECLPQSSVTSVNSTFFNSSNQPFQSTLTPPKRNFSKMYPFP